MFLFVEWIREVQESPLGTGTRGQRGDAPSPWNGVLRKEPKNRDVPEPGLRNFPGKETGHPGFTGPFSTRLNLGGSPENESDTEPAPGGPETGKRWRKGRREDLPWTDPSSGETTPDTHFAPIGFQMIYLLNLLGIENSLKSKKL